MCLFCRVMRVGEQKQSVISGNWHCVWARTCTHSLLSLIQEEAEQKAGYACMCACCSVFLFPSFRVLALVYAQPAASLMACRAEAAGCLYMCACCVCFLFLHFVCVGTHMHAQPASALLPQGMELRAEAGCVCMCVLGLCCVSSFFAFMHLASSQHKPNPPVCFHHIITQVT